VLNPAAPTPLYRQLADELAAKIQSGEFAPGDRLPSEPELARVHKLGRPTVRQATELLVRRGLIRRKRGSGTFVRGDRRSVDIFSLAGTVSSFQSRGLELQTKLLERVGLRRVDDECNPLDGRQAYSYVRLGRVEGKPVLVEHVFLDPAVFVDLHKVSLAGASLAEIVRDRYHLEPTHGEQSFEVGLGSNAIQLALGLSCSEPMLVVRRTLHFPAAPEAIHSILYCRTDQIRFVQSLGATNLGDNTP
jgi:GntR family transcriptional regulator